MSKAQQRQAVIKKSEIDALFSRLYRVYAPSIVAPLPFPFLQVAQARAWRGQNEPCEEELTEQMERVVAAGMPLQEVVALIALGEALFRPIRAVELALEADARDFFLERSKGLSHSVAAENTLRADFHAQYEMKSREMGNTWVLAAGGVYLSIKGRPPVLAPKVIGATVAVRLQRNGVEQIQAERIAANLASVLLNRSADRPIRPYEVRLWCDSLNQVKVHGDTSLTQYLADPFQALDDGGTFVRDNIFFPIHMGPSYFLSACPLPISTCLDFARLEHLIEEKIHKDSLLLCRMCDAIDMTTEQIWAHLENQHGIAPILLAIKYTRGLVRQKHARNVLATAYPGRIEIHPKAAQGEK